MTHFARYDHNKHSYNSNVMTKLSVMILQDDHDQCPTYDTDLLHDMKMINEQGMIFNRVSIFPRKKFQPRTWNNISEPRIPSSDL